VRIIELTVQNFLGIKAATIRPDGDVVRLEGKNGAGKSSLLEAIWTGLLGASVAPVKPIRRGEVSASIKIDLGELIVTRRITDKGMYLDIENKDGMRFKSPQAALDKLLTVVTVDPQAFIDMKAKDRRDLLLLMTGKAIELNNLDKERADKYDQRRLLNRQAAEMKAELVAGPDPATEIEEVPVAEVMVELETEQKRLKEKDALEYRLTGTETDLRHLEAQIEYDTQKIADLRDQIEKMEADVKKYRDTVASLHKQQKEITAAIEAFTPSRVDEIKDRIARLDEHNATARAIRGARGLADKLKRIEAESAVLTDALRGIDTRKAEILNDANLPLPGLSFSDEHLLVDGIPFDDLNEAAQITTGLKMGMALNPKIRIVTLRRGNELDKSSMAVIDAFCAENDCQVWMQRVEDEPQGGIWIEDGEVVVKAEQTA